MRQILARANSRLKSAAGTVLRAASSMGNFARQVPTYRFRGFDIPIPLMQLTGGGPETFDGISQAHIHVAVLGRE